MYFAVVENVLQFLKSQKLPNEEIQAAKMEFGINREYKYDELIESGYFASTDISFKLEEFQKYTLLWVGLSKIEHVSLVGVYYDNSKRIEFQNKTRQQALIAAKEKAEAPASTLETNVGEPLVIEEDTSLDEYFRKTRYANYRHITQDDIDKGEGIAPGKIPIRMRVKVTFSLINQEK